MPQSRLDNMVHRILRSEFAVGLFDQPAERQVPDVLHGLDVAQRVAEQSIVLLKNANGQLPLAAARVKTIAVIGSHADVGVLSGGGSAQVDPMGGNAVPQSANTPLFRAGGLASLVAAESHSRQGAACGRAVQRRNRSGRGGATGEGLRRGDRFRQSAIQRRQRSCEICRCPATRMR